MRCVDVSVLRGIGIESRNATTLCFRLPNPRYTVHIYDYTSVVTCYIYDDVNLRNVIDFRVEKRKAPNWEDLVQGFCEKACAHFPKEVRHWRSQEYQRRRR